MSGLTNYERETIINFNEGENTASVYTHNKKLRRRLAAALGVDPANLIEED